MYKWIFVLCLVISNVCSANTNADRIGIILIGDTGDDSPDKNKVAKAIENYCARELCSFALLLGDNFYNTGVHGIDDPQFATKFEIPYGNLPFVFFPVLGNHDMLGNWQAEIDYKSQHWQMPNRYYALKTKLADLFALDTNLFTFVLNNDARKQELKWLADQLSHATRNWKIVFGHHPVFSYGKHGDTEELVKQLQPLLKKYHVDFYVSGHDHDLQLIVVDGTSYVVSGAGARPRKVEIGANTKFASSQLGFAHLLLTPHTAALKFVNADAKVEFVQKYKK